jgi:hypothetical protein
MVLRVTTARVGRSITFAALFAVLAAAMACDILGPGSYGKLAVIIYYGDTATIAAPDTVAAADPFGLSVDTFGHGCSREMDRTKLEVGVHLAEVWPYNRISRADVCPNDPPFDLTHSVTIQFDKPGHATVRIHGRQLSDSVFRPVYLDRQIVVR